jgi:hypothetical protein
MSITLLLAICILGMDFMIYALFEWSYGDKRRAIERQGCPQERGGEILRTVSGRFANRRVGNARVNSLPQEGQA